MTSQHTFLVQPGIWRAEGTLTLRDGRVFPFVGQAVIEEVRPGLLANCSVLDASGAGGPRYEGAYRIDLRGPVVHLEQAGAAGPLRGELFAGPEALTHFLADPARGILAAETSLKVSDDEYRYAGLLIVHGQVQSSWEARLTRPLQPRPGQPCE